ncbi:MAG: hypothetical protein ACREHE_13020 [Rhizomicrobium sp.]
MVMHGQIRALRRAISETPNCAAAAVARMLFASDGQETAMRGRMQGQAVYALAYGTVEGFAGSRARAAAGALDWRHDWRRREFAGFGDNDALPSGWWLLPGFVAGLAMWGAILSAL